MDEVRIYSRVLSEPEIKTLAQPNSVLTNKLPVPVAPSITQTDAVNIKTMIISESATDHVNARENWPQWLGPNRDGKSRETGLRQLWPTEGPPLAWWCEGLGEGYSTVSIADGRICTTGMIDQQEILFCLNLRGQLLWQQTYSPAWHGRYPETRTTPTIDDRRAYVISGSGVVACFDLQTGQRFWTVDAAKVFGTRYDFWGIAESPLIVGDLVICTPSGTNATMVALDKKTGRTVWTTLSLGEESNYCSPIEVSLPQRRLIITMLKQSIIGVEATTGRLLWRTKYADYQSSPHGINPNSPVYHDGSFYTTSGYECGGALHQLSPNGDSITRKWVDKVLDCHHGGVVLVDGYLYGANFKGHYAGNWVCLEWATGKIMYDQKWICKGSITYADGFLYCYEEKNGTVGLVRPAPERFTVTSSFTVTKGTGPHWAHPVICGERLYIRHGNALMVYDIKS